MLRLKFQNRNKAINFGSKLGLWDFPGDRVVDSALIGELLWVIREGLSSW